MLGKIENYENKEIIYNCIFTLPNYLCSKKKIEISYKIKKDNSIDFFF
jgi:hypothetical protein